MSNLIFLMLFIIMSCLNLIGNKLKIVLLKVISKPLLMPLLLLFYINSVEENNIFIILALVFSFFGDLFLMIDKKKIFFTFGLINFLFGHILYIVSFIGETSFFSNTPNWYMLILFIYISIAYIIIRELNPYISDIKIPVYIYMVTLIIMSFSSFSLIWYYDGIKAWLPAIGSVLFVISDTLLAFNTFKKPLKNGGYKIMVTYLLAQFFIVTGFILYS